MGDRVGKKRCAIYCRKSVEEGLDMEFNSLDAQREAGENYIASQKSNGWICLPEHYDDGGYSGGNMNRPALKRLLKDAENGLIDIVLVYKLDRLSRSICDFAEISKMFDKWNVAFVSVTQELNTHTSAGRMMLNILITFAQFEREVITERVRDKMSASRKRGKWVGGNRPYGYQIVDKKLVPDETEAPVVRWIFQRFLEIQSPKRIAMELNSRGTLTQGDTPWTTARIYYLLHNNHYVGEVRYKNEVFPGEHEPLIDRETWDSCKEFFECNPPPRDSSRSSEVVSPLRGILRCGCCNAAMTPIRSKRWGRTHHYYKCIKDAKRAISTCPIKTVPAGEIERIVFDELKKILTSPEIVLEVARMTDEKPKDIIELFSEELWNEITPAEQQRLTQLLVEKVTIYEHEVKLELRTAGLKSIMEEHHEE